jgi:hypothetical protein
MTFPDSPHAEANFIQQLTTLARVRAQCERIVAATLMPCSAPEWSGSSEQRFTENLSALRQRACRVVARIDDADAAVRRAMSSKCSG